MPIIIPEVPAYIDDPKVMRAWFQSIRVEGEELKTDLVEDTSPQLGGQLDVNGNAIGDGTNKILDFIEDPSGVNHIAIENEATGAGTGPYIRSAGSDTNPNLNLVAKNAGNVRILDGADETKKLTFTLSGGASTVGVDIVSSPTGNRTITLPDVTGTLLSTGAGITVAQLADGTDGELITWDSSGNATTVPVGTSGQVLTSNGTGAAPTFQTASSGIDNVVEDTTPQLGGNLDINSKTITGSLNPTSTITYNLGTSSNKWLEMYVNLIRPDGVRNTGFEVVGSPTGDNKGTGTINAQAVYDDNTLLTCYVFDQELDGNINEFKWHNKTGNIKVHSPMKKFKSRIGTKYDPLDIDSYTKHFKEKRHLTSMPNEQKFDVEKGMPTGKWIQRLIETVEIQAIHISKLNDRLKSLERKENET